MFALFVAYLSPTQATVLPSKYQSMVKVLIMGPDEKTKAMEELGHGSGVIIGPNTIVTAKHVADLEAGQALSIIDQQGKVHEVERIQLNHKNDFAIVTVKEAFDIKAPEVSCKAVKPLERLYIVGYPLDFDSMIFENVAVDYVRDGNNIILASTGVSLPGNSGGPVFNSRGQLVGILVGEFLYGENAIMTQDTDVNIVVPTTETLCKRGMA